MALPSVLSRKIVQRLLFLRLSPPGDRLWDVLGIVPAGVVYQALQHFGSSETRPLLMVVSPTSLSARSVPADSPSRSGDVMVYAFDIN